MFITNEWKNLKLLLSNKWYSKKNEKYDFLSNRQTSICWKLHKTKILLIFKFKWNTNKPINSRIHIWLNYRQILKIITILCWFDNVNEKRIKYWLVIEYWNIMFDRLIFIKFYTSFEIKRLKNN